MVANVSSLLQCFLSLFLASLLPIFPASIVLGICYATNPPASVFLASTLSSSLASLVIFLSFRLAFTRFRLQASLNSKLAKSSLLLQLNRKISGAGFGSYLSVLLLFPAYLSLPLFAYNIRCTSTLISAILTTVFFNQVVYFVVASTSLRQGMFGLDSRLFLSLILVVLGLGTSAAAKFFRKYLV